MAGRILKGIISCVVIFIAVCSWGVTGQASAAGNRVRVISCTRDVEVTRPGGEAVNCRMDMVLTSGSRVRTAERATVALSMIDEPMNMVRIGPGSDVLLDLSGQEDGINLIDGEMTVLLRGTEKDDRFRVVTPSAVCGARGTGWFVRVDRNTTEVIVFEGEVYVKGIGPDGVMGRDGTLHLKRGYKSVITAGNEPGEPQKVDKAVLSGLKDEVTMLLNSFRSGRRRSGRRMRNEKRMQAMENRMDRALRVNRLSPGPAGSPAPVSGGISDPSMPGGSKDDDK